MSRTSLTPRTRPTRLELGLLGAIGLVTVLAYWPALAGEFAYDDFFFVVENDAIKTPARALEWVTSPDAASEGKRWGTIFRPARTVSYGLDYAAWRLNPVGFHLSSLGLHLVALAGVFFLARRCSGSGLGAVLGAAVFALHPLPSEAVAWIGARADVLGAVGALLFTLLALRPGGGPWRRVAECGLLAIALACKEACAGAVLAVAAGRWLFDPRPGAWRRAATWAVGPVLVVGVYILVRAALLGHTSRYGWLVGGDLFWTWLTVLRARVWELGRVIRPAQLSIDYTAFPYVQSLNEASVWLAILAVAAAAWLAWRCRRVAPAVSFGIAWWVALLLPVSQLVPLNALLADRWLHLPFAGLACVVAAGVAALGRVAVAPAWRATGVAVTVVAVMILAVLTWQRASDYRTEVGLWDAAAREWPESALVAMTRGCVRAPRARAALEARAPNAEAELEAVLADLARVHEIQPGEERASRIAQAYIGLSLPHLAATAAAHGIATVPDSFVLAMIQAEARWQAGERAAAEADFAGLLARSEAPLAAVDRVRVAEIVYVQPLGAESPPAGESAAVRAVARQRVARLRLESGDMAGARVELERALQEWPASEMTRCYLAQLDKDAGDLASARRRIGEVLAGQPTIQSAFVQGAEYAIEAGDPASARTILGRAVLRWPFRPELWALLAEAAVAQGETLAAAYYQARCADLVTGR